MRISDWSSDVCSSDLLQDAYVVKRLKQAGAVIMGKTVTTELMLRHPGKTRNPRNPAHTPGGSSSGSAAAVACGMRSEEHTSELQSLMRISYAVFCLKKKTEERYTSDMK